MNETWILIRRNSVNLGVWLVESITASGYNFVWFRFDLLMSHIRPANPLQFFLILTLLSFVLSLLGR